MLKKVFVSVALSALLLTGCSNDTNENYSDTDTDKVDENPFERRAGETQTVGAFGFGAVNEDQSTHHYEGEELVIDFFLDNVHHDPLEFGFFLFLNGIPQPFKVDHPNDEYQFFHKLDLDAHEYREFTFIFTPTEGEKGQTSEIYFAGIFHPSFIPDLENQNTYGHFHRMSSFLPHKLIYMEQARGPGDFLPIPHESLHNIHYWEDHIPTAMRKAYELDNQNPLDEQTFFELYEEGNYVTLDGGQRIVPNDRIVYNDKDIHLVFRGFGKPGIAYRTTLYLDHQPLKSKEHDYLEWETKAGSISTFDITLDASQLSGAHTLYSVSVPLNSQEFFSDKTHSILLVTDLEEKGSVSE